MTPEDPQLFDAVLDQAFSRARAHLHGRNTMPIGASASHAQLRRQLTRPLAQRGVEAGAVIDGLVAGVAGGLHSMNTGRFYGWVNGGTLPAALAADILTTVWDQNAATHNVSPAASVVEEVVGDWLRDLFDLPGTASFALVTGSQVAHLTCLAAARHRQLARLGWDVERQGLAGAPRLVILTSSERHGSVDRAARLLGIGSDNVIGLACSADGTLPPAALKAGLAALAGAAVIVSLQAGDLNIGAFDDFAALAPIAHAAGAWVHVDGAFGLWAACSPAHRAKTRGLNLCDSWVTDGHKWINTPYDSGIAMVADGEAHRAALSYRASYMPAAQEARDAMDYNPEWSRRARGFALYAALQELGRDGIAELVDRCCRLAQALVAGIGALPGAEVAWLPTLNQGLLRFPSPQAGASAAEDDAQTEATIAAINATGETFFGGTTWRGRRCMRVSVCGWQTSASDVERAIRAIKGVLP